MIPLDSFGNDRAFVRSSSGPYRFAVLCSSSLKYRSYLPIYCSVKCDSFPSGMFTGVYRGIIVFLIFGEVVDAIVPPKFI